MALPPRAFPVLGFMSMATPGGGAALGSTCNSANQSEDGVVELTGGLPSGRAAAVAASLTAWLAGPDGPAGPARGVPGADGLKERLMPSTSTQLCCPCRSKPAAAAAVLKRGVSR